MQVLVQMRASSPLALKIDGKFMVKISRPLNNAHERESDKRRLEIASSLSQPYEPTSLLM